MRNPALSLLLGLAIVAAGVGWIFGVPRYFDIGLRLGQVSPMVLLPGFIAAGIGAWLTLRAILLIRLREALLRGEGVLARWQIPASEWETWRGEDAVRSASYSTLRNKLRPSAAPPPMDGVPVVFGERAIVVGRAIVPLNVTGWGPFAIMQLCDVTLVPGQVPSLEFSRYITGKNARIELVRIPIGAAGRSQAQQIVDHFMTAIPQDRRAKAQGQFALHFQAQSGDIAGAEEAWRRSLPYRFAWLTGIFAAVALGTWSGWFDHRNTPPLAPDMAQLLLTGGIVLLAVTAALALIAYLREQQ